MHKKYNLLPSLFAMAMILALLSGCAQRRAFGDCAYRTQSGECYKEAVKRVKDADIMAIVFAAADALLNNLPPLNKQKSIAVSSLAVIDKPEQTSSLGRLLAEQLSTRFIRQGYTVVEIEFRRNMLAKHDQKQFTLSEELHHIARSYATEYLSAGTYATGDDRVYINLKLIRVGDGLLVSSHSFSLPLGPNTYALLRDTP
ncbi:MAG: hypothetical protein GY862_31925 [Gammaproteobacteria bacterium]|nr:hypothetical protein [Gammaproteobacteria bacterium]